MKEIINQLASHDLLQDIVEGIPIRIFWKDRESRYLGCNTLFAKYAGFSHPEELIGKTDFDMGWKDQAETYRADDLSVITSAQAKLGYEEPQTTPDGQNIWLRTSKVPLRDDKQDVIGVLGIYEDITEQKQTEDELQAIRHRHKEAQRIAHLGHWRLNLSNNELLWSEEIFRIFEIDSKQFGASYEAFLNAIHPDDRDFVNQAYTNSLSNRSEYNIEHRLLMSDGRIKWVNERCETSYAVDGTPLRSIGTVLDISERKQQQMLLEASHKRFETLFEASTDGIFILNMQGDFIDANQTAYERLGYNKKEFMAMKLTELDPPEFAARVPERLALIHEQGLATFESAHYRKDGSIMPVEINARILELDGEQVYFSVIRDITERKQSEQELQLAKFVMDNAPLNITLLDSQAQIRYLNKTGCETLGYTEKEALKLTIPDIDPLFPMEVWDEHWKDLKENKMVPVETQHRRKNGEVFPIEVMANYIKFGDEEYNVAFDRDISDRKQLEEQLHQSQKMEAIGTLVGGIAHDFNNMLAAIQGNVYLAKSLMQEHPVAVDKMANIEKLGNRAAEMVQQLLTFARKDSITMRSFCLNSFMKEAYKLAKSAIPENIDHRTGICDEILRIKGDATQLQQVLMNLLSNAVDAVAETANPIIRCNLYPYNADSAFKKRHPKLICERFACISVEDNGHGIPDEWLDKVFEPFFTSKEVGKGTGLGLAMLYGAIQTHGGIIEVESKLNCGTTFRVYLPLCENEERSIESDNSVISDGSGESILLVDDEESLRTITSEVLLSIGYQVIVASDGQEAIERLASNPQIDLVLTDIIMPRVGGIELLHHLRQSNKTLPVLFATGYDKGQVIEDEIIDEYSHIINKPFDFSTLSSVIQQMLKKGIK